MSVKDRQLQRAKELAELTFPKSVLRRDMTDEEVSIGGDIVVAYYKLLGMGFTVREMTPKLTEIRDFADGSLDVQRTLVNKALDKAAAYSHRNVR